LDLDHPIHSTLGLARVALGGDFSLSAFFAKLCSAWQDALQCVPRKVEALPFDHR
jgi:hypothetical protein